MEKSATWIIIAPKHNRKARSKNPASPNCTTPRRSDFQIATSSFYNPNNRGSDNPPHACNLATLQYPNPATLQNRNYLSAVIQSSASLPIAICISLARTRCREYIFQLDTSTRPCDCNFGRTRQERTTNINRFAVNTHRAYI